MKNLILLLVMVIGCQDLKYMDDKFSFSSAKAGSYEYPIFLQKKLCLDLYKRPGLCALQHKKNQTFQIEVEPRPYSYTFAIRCSKGILNKEVDIAKKKRLSMEIDPGTFQNLTGFSCIGEVFPHDRESISARFNFLVRLVKSDYVFREEVYKYPDGENLLAVGRHSLYTTVDTKTYKKKTIIPFNYDTKVYTESYSMRFNQYGY